MQNAERHPELAAAIEEELALDRAFQRHTASLAARQSGVCWSGPPVPDLPARSPRAIEIAARERLTRHQTWLAQDTTAYLQAMIDLQASARALHSLAERGREAWSRGLTGDLPWAEELILDMRTHLPRVRHALFRSRQAIQALRSSTSTS